MLYVERAALDNRGQLLVHGWAVSLATMMAVQVHVDEARIGAAKFGSRRDDLADAFPAYSNARTSSILALDPPCRDNRRHVDGPRTGRSV